MLPAVVLAVKFGASLLILSVMSHSPLLFQKLRGVQTYLGNM